MITYDLHILQIATGLRAVRYSSTYDYEEHILVFSWEENNFSCDCNRDMEFQRASGVPEDEVDFGPDDDEEGAGTEADRGRCGDERYAVKLIECGTGRVIYQCPRWV